MAAIISHHSFIVLAAIVLIAAGIAAWRVRRGRLMARLAGWIVFAVLLGSLWLSLRPSPSATVASLDEAESLIGSDPPTVLELYSAY